jgi:molybdopterin-guanine dinucleotide biosynthesis protein A
MGRDKATLLVDGQPMAVRVAAALRQAGADRVVAVGGDPDVLESLGLVVAPDDEPGGGPFPATLTALRQATADLVAVLSCDLVTPDPDVIHALVASLVDAPADVAAAVPVVADQPQWTHAAWRRGALTRLDAAHRDGVRSLRRAATVVPVLLVHELPAAAFADADEPRDLPGDG